MWLLESHLSMASGLAECSRNDGTITSTTTPFLVSHCCRLRSVRRCSWREVSSKCTRFLLHIACILHEIRTLIYRPLDVTGNLSPANYQDVRASSAGVFDAAGGAQGALKKGDGTTSKPRAPKLCDGVGPASRRLKPGCPSCIHLRNKRFWGLGFRGLGFGV